ncbi:MAG: hypothetical protein RIS00_1117, partial [Pseudomonadota bacterium]
MLRALILVLIAGLALWGVMSMATKEP